MISDRRTRTPRFARVRLLAFAVLSIPAGASVACNEGPPVTSPPMTPSPAPTPRVPEVPTWTPPPSAPTAIAPCPLTIRLEIRPTNDGRHEVTVFAESTTTYPQEITLPDRCPSGPIDFEGLGPGYDYYGVCNVGACVGQRSAEHVRVGPGERVPIASTKIAARGDGACTKSLSPGRYIVRPILPDAVHACVVPALLDTTGTTPPAAPHVQAPPPPSTPRVQPVPMDPRPPLPGAIATDIYSCTQASDCVLACPKVAGCCSSSCGCRHAINRAHLANYEASYKSTCQKPPKCPAEACAYQPALGAECRYGRCVATDRP